MESSKNNNFPCPCCGFLTIGECPPGTFEICVVCGWEDDEVQFDHPDSSGGANKVSLNEARANFKKFGACDKGWLKNVRLPRPDEIP